MTEAKGPVIKYVYWGGGGGVEGTGGGVYETNYLNFGGGMRRITTFVRGYETKNEWNTMSMINKTTDFYNTIYF